MPKTLLSMSLCYNSSIPMACVVRFIMMVCNACSQAAGLGCLGYAAGACVLKTVE